MRAPRGSARAVPDDAYLQLGNCAPQFGGRVQQQIDALAGIKATHVEHGEARGLRGRRFQVPAPRGQIDQFGYHGGSAPSPYIRWAHSPE